MYGMANAIDARKPPSDETLILWAFSGSCRGEDVTLELNSCSAILSSSFEAIISNDDQCPRLLHLALDANVENFGLTLSSHYM